MSRHILLLDFFLQSKGLHNEISWDEQRTTIRVTWVLNDLNLVDFAVSALAGLVIFIAQILRYDFILLINVDDIEESSVVSSVQHLIDWVPEKASVNCLVWVHKFDLLCTLSGFEPAKGLVIRYSEDQVLLRYKQHLNDTDSVCFRHLVLDGKLNVSSLTPVIFRFENINAALTITCV